MERQGAFHGNFDKSVFLIDSADEDAVMEALLEADADAEDISPTPDNQISVTAGLDQYQIITEALDAACSALSAAI